MTQSSHCLRGLRAVGLFAAASCLSGCATITGTVTGPFTGFVDLPTEIIREQELATDAGHTWLIAMVAAPVGFVGGPIFGFIKGVALDVSALNGSLSYSEEFGTYDRASVWRPYTFYWDRSEPSGARRSSGR